MSTTGVSLASSSRSTISPRGTSSSSPSGRRSFASTGTNPTARTTLRSVVKGDPRTMCRLPPRAPGTVDQIAGARKLHLMTSRPVPADTRHAHRSGRTPRSSESSAGGQVRELRLGHRTRSDEVERADEAIADPETACARDRVAERHRPMVLDEQEGSRGVVRQLTDDIPGVLIREHVDTVASELGAGDASLHGAFLARRAQTNQGADDAAELDGLVLAEVAEPLDLD